MVKRCSALVVPLIVLASVGFYVEVADTQELPVIKGKKIVASVNGENITLDEFNGKIASVKKDLGPGRKFDRRAELDLLKRMVNTRLIAQEAKNIGLDKLPENQKMIEAYSRDALREELVDRIVRDVKPDLAEIERLYKEAVREFRISAVLCDKEDEAKRFEAELRAGKPFIELAKTFQVQGRAKQIEEGAYLRLTAMNPPYAKAVSAMTTGSTSSIIQTSAGFAILRLDDIRYGENPQEKENARQAVVDKARAEALQAYDESLRKKFAKANREILDSIDYAAEKPGFEALLKDARAVAEIKGDKPITVGDLTEQMRYQFFHGFDRAADGKKLNARKGVALESILQRRLFRKEALRLGLDKTESYKGKLREQEAGVLFGTFIKKVIQPEIRLKEDEVKAYYRSHTQEFTTPEMMRIRGLVFGAQRDAEGAVEKLKRGAEFQWLAAHAEGQVDRNVKGVLAFDGALVTTRDLAEGVQKAIAGAKPGDFRLYASPEGHFYALAIQDVAMSRPQPYEEVRQEISQRLVGEKITRAVEEYADKLRAASDVKIYLKS